MIGTMHECKKCEGTGWRHLDGVYDGTEHLHCRCGVSGTDPYGDPTACQLWQECSECDGSGLIEVEEK